MRNMLGSIRRRSRRQGATVFGQVATSALALVTGLALGDVLSVRDFGMYGLLSTLYALGQGLVVAVVGEGLLFSARGRIRIPRRWARQAVLLLTLVYGAEVGVAAMIVVLGDGAGMWLWIYVAMWLPLHIVDISRILRGFSGGRNRQMLVEVGLFASALLAVGLYFGGYDKAGLVVALVGLSGIGVISTVLLASALGGGRTTSWLGTNRDVVGTLAAESLAVGSINFLGMALVGLVGGLAVVAALRAANLILGIVTPLLMSVRLQALQSLSSECRPTTVRRAVKRGVVWTIAIVIAAAGALLGLFQIPSGAVLLGGTGKLAMVVIVPVAAQRALFAAASLQLIGLRCLSQWSTSLRLRCIMALVTMAASIWGAATAGAMGAAWSGAAAAFTAYLILEFHLRRVSAGAASQSG